MSKNILLENLNQPDILELEYRNAPQEFEVQLKDALQKNAESETLRVWNARLSYCPPEAQKRISIGLLVVFCLIAALATKIPSIFSLDSDWYYSRFSPLIVIYSVIAYFLKTTEYSLKIKKVVIAGMVASIAYLTVLPNNNGSASITMALIHLPLFYLTLLAISFMSENWKQVESRLNFIRYLVSYSKD